MKTIFDAINRVLAQAESERAGLKKRIDDVISLAAVVGGNDSDDYLTRSNERSEMLKNSDLEIRRGQDRLAILDQNIDHFNFLKSELQTRFSGTTLSS